jgi:uncharacterized membrane protein
MLFDPRLIFYWWLILVGIGISGLPLSHLLFKKFSDRGWGLSKILGILLVSYIVWILASLRLLPFSKPTIILMFVLLAVFSWLLSIKFFNFKMKSFFQRDLVKLVIFEEAFFLIVLFGWSIIRGFQPDINGLEKFMDFGFINSILRSSYMPPSDMWWSQGTINYYYFGHFTVALLTKLSGIASNFTFNLALASTLALVAISSFSIIFTLTKKYWTGVLAFLFVAIVGNLHTLTIFAKGISAYWYPDASRLVPFVINEFPAYTFVVSDLHAHLMDMPFVLLAIAFLFSFVIERKIVPANFFFLALTLGTMYATSSWDFPIYLLVSGALILYIFLAQEKLSLKIIAKTASLVILLAIIAIILFLPFFLNFKPIATSIGFVHSPSPLGLIFLLWGFWGFITLSFVLLFWTKRLERSNFDRTALIFVAIAFSLIILTEIIYVKDIYGGDYYRSNTVFKVTYQSWIILAISCAYALSRIKETFGQKVGFLTSSWWILFLFFFAFTLLYPILAIKSYYNGLKSYQGLDGTRYLENRYPEDYAAITWLNKNIKGQPVIVEATGESYTDYARISTNTGLPAIVGWPIHEWLWRGTYDVVAPRNSDVQTIFESQDLSLVKAILSKYEVNYIYIGGFEREKYSALAEEKFNLLGKIVFEKGQTRIYQIF